MYFNAFLQNGGNIVSAPMSWNKRLFRSQAQAVMVMEIDNIHKMM